MQKVKAKLVYVIDALKCLLVDALVGVAICVANSMSNNITGVKLELKPSNGMDIDAFIADWQKPYRGIIMVGYDPTLKSTTKSHSAAVRDSRPV